MVLNLGRELRPRLSGQRQISNHYRSFEENHWVGGQVATQTEIVSVKKTTTSLSLKSADQSFTCEKLLSAGGKISIYWFDWLWSWVPAIKYTITELGAASHVTDFPHKALPGISAGRCDLAMASMSSLTICSLPTLVCQGPAALLCLALTKVGNSLSRCLTYNFREGLAAFLEKKNQEKSWKMLAKLWFEQLSRFFIAETVWQVKQLTEKGTKNNFSIHQRT